MTDTGITRDIAVGIPMAERRPVWRLLHTPAQGARASLQALTTDLPSGTYFRAAVQPVGQAGCDRFAQEGPRSGGSPPAVGDVS
jgi:hypothetical protein